MANKQISGLTELSAQPADNDLFILSDTSDSTEAKKIQYSNMIPDASATVKGKVELATTAETETGTDATRAVTPDGLHDMTTLAGAAWLKDEDNMSSDSATTVPSQQSVKAYVDSGTVTMTNKTLTAPVITTPTIRTWDGWNSVSDSWTYASPTTITVPSGAASLYSKGDKIKFTQTTVKYFYVVTVADTLLTVTGGSDYTLANAAISAISVSHEQCPVGFPQWFAYTTTYGGFSAAPTQATRFCLMGKTAVVSFGESSSAGTSNATSFTATLPIAAESGTQTMYGRGVDNSSTSVRTRLETTAGSTTLTITRTEDGNSWTNTNLKSVIFAGFTYEID